MSGFANLNACVLGNHCFSGPQSEGQNLCTYCRNISVPLLYQRAGQHPNKDAIRQVIIAYRNSLEAEGQQAAISRQNYLCASKDQSIARNYGFSDFNPKSRGNCTRVNTYGQLCNHCYTKAQAEYPRLTELFDGNNIGFPCVFTDPRYMQTSQDQPVPPGWKFLKEKDWEGKDVPLQDWFPPYTCARSSKAGRLCQRCFDRLSGGRHRFGKYFRTTTGDLRSEWSIGSVR